MPSADFCAAVRSSPDSLSPAFRLPSGRTRRRSPEVGSTTFAAHAPNLQPRPLMDMDFAVICPLVRPGLPCHRVSVRRVAALLHASFGPHLLVAPLRFANPSPPSGWIEDSHLQVIEHARHTSKSRNPRRDCGSKARCSCHGLFYHEVGVSGGCAKHTGIGAV
jgi:hypothetical protein